MKLDESWNVQHAASCSLIQQQKLDNGVWCITRELLTGEWWAIIGKEYGWEAGNQTRWSYCCMLFDFARIAWRQLWYIAIWPNAACVVNDQNACIHCPVSGRTCSRSKMIYRSGLKTYALTYTPAERLDGDTSCSVNQTVHQSGSMTN